MIITFECMAKGCSPGKWSGTLELIKAGNPCEAEVSARGKPFPSDCREARIWELHLYSQLGHRYGAGSLNRQFLECGTVT